jgi:hypothetical protein
MFMDKKLQKELSNLPEDFVALVIIPRAHHEKLHLQLIKYMVKGKNSTGAYVTLNRPYFNLIKAFQKDKVNHRNLLFVDCITKKESRAKNCVFLQSARSLSTVSLALNPVYKSTDMSFVFFDSIDSLALYHDPNMVLRFARSFVEKLREHGKRGIILGLREEIDQKMVDELSVVCDTVIELGA